MAIILPSYISTVLPAFSINDGINNAKSLRIVGIVVGGVHFTWKLLRKLSFNGNSKNPLVKYLHSILRRYLNHGFLIRNEFSANLPWQFYLLLPGRYAIVNYGSYGTVPRKVENYQMALQHEFEMYPDYFYRITIPTKYTESREIVARAVGCKPSNLVFTENITEAMNCTLRSFLPTFQSGDAVLCINIGYSAVLKGVNIYTRQYNVKLYELEITFPIKSDDEIVELFENMFKNHDNIKMAIFDHITSASALILPIEKLCKLCHDYDVISVVDGAHAPGQLHLNIEKIGADIYAGNLHKWYYTPKACAIMYVDPKFHDIMQPALVSHGCYGDMHERFRRQATRSYSSVMTAGYAVGDFMENLGGITHLHEYVTPMVEWAVELYKREWNTEELDVPVDMKAPYMRIVYLPPIIAQVYGANYAGADQMIIDLLHDYKLAIFINPIQGRLTTRVSAQIFSTKGEYYYAARAIKDLAAKLEEKYGLSMV